MICLRVAAVVMLLFLSTCGTESPQQSDEPDPQPTDRGAPPLVVAFLAPEPLNSTSRGWLNAAKLAATEVSKSNALGRSLEIKAQPISGPSLAGLTDDDGVIGAITAEGFDALEAAGEARTLANFPTFELSDDLYEAGALEGPVFQISPPHSWQAFRLARYFGPGDRGYKKVALLREPGRKGEAAARALSEVLPNRGLQFLDTPGDLQQSLVRLAQARPEAVVIEGGPEFRKQAVAALSEPNRRYEGKMRISSDWRPQPALFSDGLAEEITVAGAVASGDYASSLPQSGVVASAKEFEKAYSEKAGTEPIGYEVGAYDSVRILAEAFRRGTSEGKPPSRARVLEELEKFDRVRFGHLPVSLGPDDHVVAERDVQGVWSAVGGADLPRWKHIMRTFTSDPERTNVLEEDWASFFPGADPKGEAPFYYQSKVGIVTKPEDNLN